MTPGGPILPSVLHFLRRSPSDRGAAAVEFALLFPVFMTLAMGLIAAGTAFSRQINVTQAAREASRYGATYDFQAQSPAMTLDQWLVAVDTAVTESAGNPDDPMGGYDYRCVALVSIDSSGNVVTGKSKYLEHVGTAPATTGSGACPSTKTAKFKTSDYVQVAMYRKSSFFVLFANPTVKLDSVSVTPYEGKELP